ncbi:unnamed protein product [Somion occarium]|uniref:Uncharacterized protein n=1 Tax=Somion occarium TaxID=3059160 RepID=A0ABP1DTG2_9APHY
MSLFLHIQLKGEAARSLVDDQYKRVPKYPDTMKEVLGSLGIPLPHKYAPIWKSGVIKGIYSEHNESTSFYNSLDSGFSRARNSASMLEKYSIKYIKLCELGSQKWYLNTGDRWSKATSIPLALRIRPVSSSTRRELNSPREPLIPQTSAAGFHKNDRADDSPAEGSAIDSTMERLLSISRSLSDQTIDVQSIKPDPDANSPMESPPMKRTRWGGPQAPVLPSTIPPSAENRNQVVEAHRALWDVRRELATLRSREKALFARIKALGSADSLTDPEERQEDTLRHRLELSESLVVALQDDLHQERLKNKELHWQYVTQSHRLEHLETALEKATRDMNGRSLVPAIMSAMTRISYLSDEALDAARREAVHGKG